MKAEEAAGQRFGIRAVPYFLLNKSYGISGAQPLDIFVSAITNLHVRRTEVQPTSM